MSKEIAHKNHGVYVFMKRKDEFEKWHFVVLDDRYPAFTSLGEARAFWKRNFTDLMREYRITFIDIFDGSDGSYYRPDGTAGEEKKLEAVDSMIDDFSDKSHRALAELVDKIAPGLDSGDILSDAETASRMLDGRLSEPRIEAAFGLGQVAVTLGEHGGRPCVYLAPARLDGKKPGDAVDNASEGLDKHAMRADESVLTFPTYEQARVVQHALCGKGNSHVEANESHASLLSAAQEMIDAYKNDHGDQHNYGLADLPPFIALQAAINEFVP